MSETEHYRGKLVKVDLEGKTAEEFARRVLVVNGTPEKSSYYNDCLEALRYEYDEKYHITENGTLYEIQQLKNIDVYDDIYEAERNEDGSIDFEVKFYNGGCPFSEALDSALEKLEVSE